MSRFPWLPWREKQQVVLNQRAVGLKVGNESVILF